MMISRKSLSMLLAGIGILVLSESSFAQSGGSQTSGSSGSSSGGRTTSGLGGQTTSMSGSTLSSGGGTTGSGSTGGTTTNNSSGRTTGSGSTGTGTGNTGMVGANGSQNFVGGNAAESFVGGGRQQSGNSATSNRQFRGITDMQQVPGSNGQQTGTPRRVQTSLRVGFNFPAPNSPAADSSPSNLPSFDRFLASNPELTGINVAISPAGVAVISGATRSVETRRLAANLIRIQPGVRKVENQVEVTGE